MKVEINIPKHVINLLNECNITNEVTQRVIVQMFVEEVLESHVLGLGGAFDDWWEQLPEEVLEEVLGHPNS
jgi:hypothetical protein